MDPQALLAAFGVITAATVGVVEAVSQIGLPPAAKPLASIVIGVVLAVVYIVLPATVQPLYLVILAGAVGTGGVAVAKRLGGQPKPA